MKWENTYLVIVKVVGCRENWLANVYTERQVTATFRSMRCLPE